MSPRTLPALLLGAVLLSACTPAPLPAPAHAPHPESGHGPGHDPSIAAPTAARPADVAPEPPEEPLRAVAPVAGDPPRFVPPVPSAWALPSGVGVVFLRTTTMPVVSVRLVVRRGCADVAPRDHEACDILDAVMQRGTTHHGARALVEAFEALGARWGVYTASDIVGGSFAALSSSFAPALELFAEVIESPALSDEELALQRSVVLSSKDQATRQIVALARAAGQRAVYGPGSGYGWWAIPKPREITAVSRAELARTYRQTFLPTEASLVIVGDLDESVVRAAVARAFGSWTVPRTPANKGAIHPVPQKVTLVDRPGATQSAVYLTEGVIEATSADRPAFELLSYILGGDGMNGRISKNLRETKGYTYGVYTSLSLLRPPSPGRLFAGGTVQADKTGPSVVALLDEVRRIREEPVTAEELQRAKKSLMSVVDAFETSAGTEEALSDVVHQGLPVDFYVGRAERFDRVTPEDVQRVAARYLEPAAMRIVIAGDRAVVEPQLREAGLNDVVVVDAYGDAIAGGAKGARVTGGLRDGRAQGHSLAQ